MTLRAFRLVLIPSLCVLLLPAPLPAQDDDNAFRVGTHVLRVLMHHRKLRPLEDWQRLTDNPAQSILVFLGRPTDRDGINALARFPRGTLFNFVNDGGAVLVATDHRLENRDLMRLCGHFPQGARVSAWPPEGAWVPAPEWQRETNIDDRFLYRGRQAGLRDCIVVNPEPKAAPTLFWNDLGRQHLALKVVTNRSTYLQGLRFFPNPVSVLARFPPGCYYSDRSFLPRGDTPPAFAVSAEVGAGRVLMLADHSVFINEMLLQEDNNNLDFAYKTIEWLREGKRTSVLFVEDGEIQTEFNVPLRPQENPLQELQRRAALLVQELTRKSDEEHRQTNYLNHAIINFLNDVPGRFIFGRSSGDNFVKMLVLLAGIAAAVFGFSRLVRASQRGEPGVPLFANLVGRQRSTVSPLVLRQRAAISDDDLREIGREAAREWFASLPGAPQDEASRHPPRVEAAGGWWHARKLRLEVLDLWRLATGTDPPQLTHRLFRRLLTRLERLRAAVEAEEIKIHW
jgi:hypothetical protein